MSSCWSIVCSKSASFRLMCFRKITLNSSKRAQSSKCTIGHFNQKRLMKRWRKMSRNKQASMPSEDALESHQMIPNLSWAPSLITVISWTVSTMSYIQGKENLLHLSALKSRCWNRLLNRRRGRIIVIKFKSHLKCLICDKKSLSCAFYKTTWSKIVTLSNLQSYPSKQLTK